MTPLSVTAPAKLNLYLHVTGRRDDGYHLLESLVVFTDFGDRLTVRPAAALSLEITGPFADGLPVDEDNLILKAARALQSALGIADGAQIHLEKALPVAAGIGGGSADAAAALKALMTLWGETLPDLALMHLALSLGADVPVCMDSAPAHMRGIGEVLVPAPAVPPLGVLLVNPRVPLSTPAVFRARKPDFGAADGLPDDAFATSQALLAGLESRRNDLTEAACTALPVVADVLHALNALPGCRLARMSGSGATCLGLFDDLLTAQLAAEQLTAQSSGWWVRATRLRTNAPAIESPV